MTRNGLVVCVENRRRGTAAPSTTVVAVLKRFSGCSGARVPGFRLAGAQVQGARGVQRCMSRLSNRMNLPVNHSTREPEHRNLSTEAPDLRTGLGDCQRRRAVPGYGALQAFFEGDARLVVEDAARLGDVGLRIPHVACPYVDVLRGRLDANEIPGDFEKLIERNPASGRDVISSGSCHGDAPFSFLHAGAQIPDRPDRHWRWLNIWSLDNRARRRKDRNDD